MNDIIIDKDNFIDEAQNGILYDYLQNIGNKGNDTYYIANTNGNDNLYRLILYVNQEGVFYTQAYLTESILQEQGQEYEIQEDGHIYQYSDFPVKLKEFKDWIKEKIEYGINYSQEIYKSYKENFIKEIIENIESKNFGMIGFVVYLDKNNKKFEIALAETRMGIDFSDPEDMEKYNKQSEWALSYAKRVYYPILKSRLPDYDIIISKNSLDI